MKKLLSILLLFITPITFSQPNFEWVDQPGGSNSDGIMDVVTDATGNVYACGFDNGRIKVHKRNEAGAYVWTKTVNGTTSASATSITLDNGGNVLVTGYFDGTADFDPGAGTFNLTSNGNADIFVLKLNASGNFIWAVSIGGTDIDRGYSLKTDGLNNVVVTGVHRTTVDFDPGVGVSNLTAGGGLFDYFVLKLDVNGNYLWAISSQNSGSETGESIEIDGSDNILVTGEFTSTQDFDPGAGVTNLTPSSSKAGYLLKLDSGGNLVWVKMFTGNNICTPKTVNIDSNGDIITTGEFMDDLDTDPGAGTSMLNTNGEQDIYVIKLNANGGFIWAKSFGGTVPDESFAVTTDASNNIYTTGYFETTVDFDPGAGTFNLTDNGIYDIFVQKLDQNGDFLWAIAMGGSSWDRGNGIALYEPDGSLYLGGYFNNTVDFDPGVGTYNLTVIGSSDSYLLKLSDCTPSSPIPDVLTLSDLSGNCSVSMPTAPTASNCLGTYTGIPDLTFPISTQGTTVVTWTYDDGNGNTSTQTQNVIIDDVTAPIADIGSLSNVTSECSVTSLTAPTATDNCAGTITGTHNATLPITTQGSTVVTWTYDDGNGNTSTQTQNVIIDDVSAPVANLGSLSDVNAQCSVASLTAPTAIDNCTGSITGTHNAALPITSQGTTVVTWTYNDGNGNTSTQMQNVVIDDATAPVANVVNLSDITSECEVTSLSAPTATDNCAGTITGTHNATLPITMQGTTVVTWTYNDGNGNTSTQTQNVVIDDATAPVPDIPNLPVIADTCELTALSAPTATDNCGGTIVGVHNATFPITSGTVVTWTYDDGNGNIFTQDQTISIYTISNLLVHVNDTTFMSPTSNCSYQWIDCNNGNQPIFGETDQTFVATQNGSYAVITTYGSCSVTSECVNVNSIGLDELGETSLMIYPNPTSGDVTISSETTFTKVELVNALGQLVVDYNLQESSSYQLKLPEENGVYFIKIYFADTVLIKSIVKK